MQVPLGSLQPQSTCTSMTTATPLSSAAYGPLRYKRPASGSSLHPARNNIRLRCSFPNDGLCSTLSSKTHAFVPQGWKSVEHPGWVKVDHPKGYWMPIQQHGTDVCHFDN